jgi:hypothetical protein
MKYLLIIFFSICSIYQSGFSQIKENTGSAVLFHGLVLDANTFSPIPNSHITVNGLKLQTGSNDGTFSFYVNRKDTVEFKSLGYKPTTLYVSDTLTGRDFLAGVYMKSDTLSIGEVIIVPRVSNLKSEIMNGKRMTPETMENAKYNVAVSAYQGRASQNQLGNPASNYDLIQQRQKTYAYEKGGIPSDKIIGISPLIIIPAAYLLFKGLPEKPEPLTPPLTQSEIDQIQKLYLQSLKQRK